MLNQVCSSKSKDNVQQHKWKTIDYQDDISIDPGEKFLFVPGRDKIDFLLVTLPSIDIHVHTLDIHGENVLTNRSLAFSNSR